MTTTLINSSTLPDDSCTLLQIPPEIRDMILTKCLSDLNALLDTSKSIQRAVSDALPQALDLKVGEIDLLKSERCIPGVSKRFTTILRLLPPVFFVNYIYSFGQSIPTLSSSEVDIKKMEAQDTCTGYAVRISTLTIDEQWIKDNLFQPNIMIEEVLDAIDHKITDLARLQSKGLANEKEMKASPITRLAWKGIPDVFTGLGISGRNTTPTQHKAGQDLR
jgi:hypothetical protein